MNENYFENRDNKNIIKTREIVASFPKFANEFFLGIQMRTSPLTRLNYAYDLRIFFDYLSKNKFDNIPISELTLENISSLKAIDIEIFIDYLSSYKFNGKKFNCGENAKSRKLSTLRSFFKYYYKKDKLPENITAKVDLPKIHDKSIIRLEPDEVVKLLNVLDSQSAISGMSEHQNSIIGKTKQRDFAILTLFLGTGIRISECVGLNRSDIDFNINGFKVTRKGGNQSILYFSDEVSDALKKYIEWLDCNIQAKTDFGIKIKNESALFLSLQGKRMSVRSVELLVKKYSKIITPLKKITPHKLRSTYGTSLYHATQDIYVVAEVLGHKDINTTKKHYAAMSDEIKRSASKAVKLRDNDDQP